MLTTDDIQQLKDVLIPVLNESLDTKLDEKLKPVKEDIAKIRKDVNAMLSVFDNEYVDLRSRLERIEEHLKLTSYFK